MTFLKVFMQYLSIILERALRMQRSFQLRKPSKCLGLGLSKQRNIFLSRKSDNESTLLIPNMMVIKMLHNNLLFWGEDLFLQIVVFDLREPSQRVIIKGDTANVV